MEQKRSRVLTFLVLSCFQFHRKAGSTKRERIGRGVHGELDKRVQDHITHQKRLGNVSKQDDVDDRYR